MNNFLTVFKMMVKSINLGNSSNSKKRRITLSFSNPFINSLLTTLLFTIIGIIFLLTLPSVAGYDILTTYASFAFNNTISITLLFSTSYIFSSYFLNNDDLNYLHLPISGETIFSAKFFSSFILGCLIPISAPLSYWIVVIIKGLKFNFFTFLTPFLFYIGSQFLISSLIFLLGIFLSEVCKLKNHKQVMSAIYFVLILIFSCIFGFEINYINSRFFMDTFNHFILGFTGRSNIFSGIITLLIGILSFALIYFLARFTYLKSLQVSTLSHSKKLSEKELDQQFDIYFQKKYSKKSLFFNYVSSEFKSIIKSGTYLFSFVVPILFFGIVIIIILPISLISLKTVPIFSDYLSLMIFGIGAPILNIVNTLPCVSYSKDMKTIVGLSILPVDNHQLFWAKLFPSTTISYFLIILYFFIYAIVFPYHIFELFIYFIAAMISSLALNYINQILDLKLGNTNAPNELSITRNNKSVMISTIFRVAISILLGIISLLHQTYMNILIPPLLTLTISILLFLIPFAKTNISLDSLMQKYIFKSNN